MTTTTTWTRDTTLAEYTYADENAALDAIDATSTLEQAVSAYAGWLLRLAQEDAPTVNQGRNAGDFVEALFAPEMRAMYLERLKGIDWHAIADHTVRKAQAECRD